MPHKPRSRRCPTWPRTNALDLTRKRYGFLWPYEETDQRDAAGHVVWLCRCRRRDPATRQECGSIVLVSSRNLLSGNTLSCGCWRREVSSQPNQERAAYRAANRGV